MAVPALAGCLAVWLLGNVLAVPLLGQTAQVYGVGALRRAGLGRRGGAGGHAAAWPRSRAAAGAARRAAERGPGDRDRARAPAPAAATPRTGCSAGCALPRPVTIGLAAPFARPARTAVTLTAVVLGATAVTFAVGLGTSLSRVYDGLNHAQAEPVQVYLPRRSEPSEPGGGPGDRQPGAAPSLGRRRSGRSQAALRAQPGTLHYIAEADEPVSVAGLSQQLAVTAFRGNASLDRLRHDQRALVRRPAVRWTSPPTSSPTTGKAVGDTSRSTSGRHADPVRIAGEVFDTSNGGPGCSPLVHPGAAVDPGLAPDQYDVALKPGTNAQAYANALRAALGQTTR